ncbi:MULTISPECIES: extracellular solute-binding protein [Streptomyces]|uniref:Extracellular solute-binding protein n=1 Tax=Streptomyces evansiae TaxID=3075535 RepID=A0ABD5E7Y3_9ACTN|nr:MULTISPECIES: extracellular solute-binding protein [unclassified Streptomyces]ASY31591.1 sugar ABC transporter substrate-binding protein [Streptomyces sp. CLI2509]MDT0417534.1 extracellular solute-binding protein [Streptomyces sp. DSM 41982]MYX21529.1 extracellular solute-binding protein [Streptomyces sp. SID8380]SCD39746.1 ABC-type glycerol-3-phosphate transport system, substrate-binding protein [Streptomyces sp. SolWspMP-sol7th]
MRRTALAATTVVLATALTACGGSGSGSSSSEEASAPKDPAKVSGTITVLTNRTDQVQDGTLKGYAARFNKIYPRVKVKFQGITDYEGDVKIRMNSENYGDVLSIPASVPLKQYPNFFSPLGAAKELSGKYDFTDHATVDGKVYGIANIGTANGFVYNKAVWKKAGITQWPRTPAAFLDALQAIKSKTGATPYYTNYHDGWPLTNWGNALGSPSCDPAANDKLATTKEPWAKGQDLHVVDTLLHDIVHRKLSEADPTTTNWENSKTLIGTGKIGTMWLGSWAVVQMRDAAKKAGHDPEDIGFMPFPAQHDGKFCSVVRPDYQYAVNKHSAHKDAARAWLDWYIDKSGDAQATLSISSLKSAPLPGILKPFQEQGTKLIHLGYGKNALVDEIDKASEVGLNAQDYPQHLIDVARGTAGGDLDGAFAELNKKWSEAQGTLG